MLRPSSFLRPEKGCRAEYRGRLSIALASAKRIVRWALFSFAATACDGAIGDARGVWQSGPAGDGTRRGTNAGPAGAGGSIGGTGAGGMGGATSEPDRLADPAGLGF